MGLEKSDFTHAEISIKKIIAIDRSNNPSKESPTKANKIRIICIIA